MNFHMVGLHDRNCILGWNRGFNCLLGSVNVRGGIKTKFTLTIEHVEIACVYTHCYVTTDITGIVYVEVKIVEYCEYKRTRLL